jgi:Ran-binding protein 9/10
VNDDNDDIGSAVRRGNSSSRQMDNVTRGTTSRSECVAIGLGTADFDVSDKMPGWDRNSIGYHGDDGGLFYGAGTMSRQIGPSYGVGDTIGCGVDYAGTRIFFTWNGSFLGYEPIRSEYLLHCDLYPVIGIDTNSPISCNFGTSLQQQFQFDLLNLIREQKENICQAFTTASTTKY